jgi:riboflavin transporter FmnP
MIQTSYRNGTKLSFKIRDITKIALLSSIAVVLMFISFPIPLFPAFLKIDLSDLPALIGAFAMGPVTGVIIEFIKNILHFFIKNDGTGGVGNLANFIVGISFVVPAAVIYGGNKTKKGALIGMIVGIISMVIVASLANYYVIIPLYARIFSMEAILGMMSQANNAIVDLKTYILYAVIPFNMLKAVIISLITLLIYKKVSPILHR